MRVIGLSLVIAAAAMFILGRPRGGKVVHWLRSDNRQWAYAMAIVVLIGVGFTLSLFGT